MLEAAFSISRKDLVTLTCESSFLDIKNAPRGCALARSCSMSQATVLGARMCFAHSLFYYVMLQREEVLFNSMEG